jgi:hypothetical protein
MNNWKISGTLNVKLMKIMLINLTIIFSGEFNTLTLLFAPCSFSFNYSLLILPISLDLDSCLLEQQLIFLHLKCVRNVFFYFFIIILEIKKF